jgi:hypothetical protein
MDLAHHVLRRELEPWRNASGRDGNVALLEGDVEVPESRGQVAGEGTVDGVQERGCRCR